MKVNLAALQADAELEPYLARGASYTEELRAIAKGGGYSHLESSINLPFDNTLIQTLTQEAHAATASGLKFVVVIGIGGSHLGTKAIYDALYGFADVVEPERYPRCLFLDAIDSELFKKLNAYLSSRVKRLEELSIVLISKSGTTTESVVNASILFANLSAALGSSVEKCTTVITDSGSPLASYAKENGLRHIEIPKNVGGRFSVFSAVGLFPLALLGVPIQELASGGIEAVTAVLDENSTEPLNVAAVLARCHDTGIRIHDTFLFSSRLESLGKWYRQLLGESIGKKRDTAGALIRIGITPTISIGSTDLHSVAQLYLAGPRDRITTFVSIAPHPSPFRLGQAGVAALIPKLHDHDYEEIHHAIYQGVVTTYAKQKLLYLETELESVTPRELGMWMQFNMMMVMYLGKLLDVNAFDQPEVELYKQATRELL